MARPESSIRVRPGKKRDTARERGLTLVELIITIALLLYVFHGFSCRAMTITPYDEGTDRRHELRRDLWEMRDAIDHYKDVADSGAVQIKDECLMVIRLIWRRW